jgi:uncharacterized RDD family membrane protein YckC
MTTYASTSKRAAAALFDYILFTIVYNIYRFALDVPGANRLPTVVGVDIIPVLIFWLIYFPVIEGVTGQTLGKKLFGIRVLRVDGSNIGLINSFLRRLLDWLDLAFFGLIAIIVSGMNGRNQRIGDMVAGTVVKKEKVYICGQCRQSLSLDQTEILRGQYVCPSCGAANHSLTIA